MRLRFLAAAFAVALLPSLGLAEERRAFHVADIAERIEDPKEPAPPDPDRPRTDVVVLSEGYPKEKRDAFFAAARQLARTVRETKTAAPMREVTTFHFVYVFVPSIAKGAPWRTGEEARNTPFGAHVGEDGMLDTDDAAFDRAVRHCAPGGHATVGVVLINLLSKRQDRAEDAPPQGPEDNAGPEDVRALSDTPEFTYVKLDRCRRGGHQVGRIRQIAQDSRSFLHELGHARFGLDDEYANDDWELTEEWERGAIANFPNCTTDKSGQRWRALCPELFDADGRIKEIHEGGAGYGKRVWHASTKCRMLQTRSQEFCAVCTAVIRGTREHARTPKKPQLLAPAEGATVVLEKPGAKVHVRWTDHVKDPHCFRLVLWRDGNTKPSYTADLEGHEEALDLALAPGSWRIELTARSLAMARKGATSEPATASFTVEAAEGVRVKRRGITGSVR